MGISTGTISGQESQITYANIDSEHLLEKMIATHGSGLLRYCHSILLDYHEAQDVVQSTFIKAYSKISSPESLNASKIHGAWLYRAAYTACIDVIRRKKLQSLFFLKNSIQDTTTTPEYFMSDNVNSILSKLSPKDRALVFSRAVEGLEYNELVTVYGSNAAALRKRYERAKSKLVKTLKASDLYEGGNDLETK